MSMNFIVPTLRVATITGLSDFGVVEEIFS
jgi:hypothetical protein